MKGDQTTKIYTPEGRENYDQINWDSSKVCDCYPEHCQMEDVHGECWCSPEIIVVGDSMVIVHNEEH